MLELCLGYVSGCKIGFQTRFGSILDPNFRSCKCGPFVKCGPARRAGSIGRGLRPENILLPAVTSSEVIPS